MHRWVSTLAGCSGASPAPHLPALGVLGGPGDTGSTCGHWGRWGYLRARPPRPSRMRGAAAAEQGLSSCLVTTATFQKCTLLQPAPKLMAVKGTVVLSGSFSFCSFLKKKKKKKEKSLSVPALLFFSALSSHLVPQGGHCPFHPPLLGVQLLSFLNCTQSGRKLRVLPITSALSYLRADSLLLLRVITRFVLLGEGGLVWWQECAVSALVSHGGCWRPCWTSGLLLAACGAGARAVCWPSSAVAFPSPARGQGLGPAQESHRL